MKPRPPDELPTLHHFTDLGIVSARSDWSGDESLLVYKCGPLIGHKAIDAFSYDPGGAHVHPDCGHFVLFGQGQWLITDDGLGPKQTANHNTLLVDGRGQLGEGHDDFLGEQPLAYKANPSTLCAESHAGLDHVAGDAAAAYPPSCGLRKFRDLLFVKPGVLIVVDDITTDRECNLELRFHMPSQPVRQGDGAYAVTVSDARLRILPVADEKVEVGPLPENVANTVRDASKGLALRNKAAQWRNAVVFTWSAGESPRARGVDTRWEPVLHWG